MIVTPTPRVPDEIRDEAVIVHFPPPTAAELSADLDTLLATSGIACSLSPGGREKIIQAALGMTLNQARRAFSKAIVTHGTLDDRDIDGIIADKKDILTLRMRWSFTVIPRPRRMSGASQSSRTGSPCASGRSPRTHATSACRPQKVSR